MSPSLSKYIISPIQTLGIKLQDDRGGKSCGNFNCWIDAGSRKN